MPLLASESSDCDLVMHLLLAARHVETFLCEPQGSPNDFNRLMIESNTSRLKIQQSDSASAKVGRQLSLELISHLDQLRSHLHTRILGQHW